jgi:cholesterol transport system auxiliary component
LAAVCPLLALGALGGCGLLAPAPPPPMKAVLDQVPDGVPRAARRAGVLVVVVSGGAPLYDATAIAYRTHDAEIGYFARHEWADRPSRMLQPLVVKTLQETAAFTAVLGPPYFGHAPATLRIEIDRLLADFRPAVGTLRFGLHAVLRDDAGRVALRTIAIEQPIASETPEAVVRAANDATAQALLQVSQFVVEPR